MSLDRMPVAIKKCPRGHDAFVTYVNHIVTCLDGNATFSNPMPSVAVLKARSLALALANARATSRDTVAVADRLAKRVALEGDLDDIVEYVRRTLRALAPEPEAAATLILGTGLSIRKRGRARKPAFTVKHGPVSGEVVLAVRAVAKTAVYYWEISSDGESWSSLPDTLKTRTTVSGLAPGQTYYFRFRARTSKGLLDPSNVVRIIVL